MKISGFAVFPPGRVARFLGARCLGVLLAASAFSVAARPQEKDTRPQILQEITIDQKLNEQLPLDLQFKDETGKIVTLRQYFGKKPVVLSFAYYECPMLCTLVLNGLVAALRALPLDLGKDFEAVNISINPKEKPALAASTKHTYAREYGRAGGEAGWHFLTGDEASIRKAAAAAGYHYKLDPSTGQYAHATGIMVLTPDGKLSRYFYGLEYSARDLRLALVEASSGKIGSPVDQVLLYCFHYDPVTGKYGLVITHLIRLIGISTALALGLAIFIFLRRERLKLSKQLP
jgi:protein SCO1/2